MAIITTQQFINNETPFFVNYQPYTLSENLTLIENVNEMFSYNLIPNDIPIQVDYFVGAENNIRFIFSIKNLTLNTRLQVDFIYDNNFFMIQDSDISFILPPQEIKNIDIVGNKDQLNVMYTGEIKHTNLSINVTNINDGQMVVKNSLVGSIDTVELPPSITII